MHHLRDVSRLSRLLLGASLLTLAAAPAHAESSWSFSTGLDYSSGDYGEGQDTTIYQIPLSAWRHSDHWSFGVSVPFVRLDGTGNIVPGSSGVGGVSAPAACLAASRVAPSISAPYPARAKPPRPRPRLRRRA